MNFQNVYQILTSKYFLSSASLLFTYTAYRKHKEKQDKENFKHLEKNESLKRKNHILDLKYKLFLDLANLEVQRNSFEGFVEIDLMLSSTEGVFLDFFGEIKKIFVNQKEILVKQEGNRIYFNDRDLIKGRNIIEINFVSFFSNPKMKEVKGLQFVTSDNNGGKKLVSNFEPFYAHRVFPCFDQPDLKSDFQIQLYTTKDLTVIGNSAVDSTRIEEIPIFNHNRFDLSRVKLRNRKLITFKEIKQIPPYQLMICGGNLIELNDQNDLTSVNIYIKKKLEDSVDKNFINFLIYKSLSWFSGKFDSIYPYNRIDVVFLPNYSQVASSAPGGVIILDEQFLNPTTDYIDINYSAILLVSQVVSMWLSNSITIKWWEDSFFFSSLNLFLTHLFFIHNKKKLDEDLQNTHLLFDFFKSKAILADKSNDTHPVLMDVENTEEAEIFFDEISCFKGACLIKYFYNINQDTFDHVLKSFISLYTNKKAAGYREFFDIYSMVQQAESKEDTYFLPLNQFEYLLINERVPRLSCILPETNESSDQFNKLIIIQDYPQIFLVENEDPIYYPYTLDILLKYDDREEVLKNIQIHPKKVNVINLCNLYEKPLCVILDPNDNVFITQKFDESSRNYLFERTGGIINSITRVMIIRNMYNMIRDGDLDPLFFVKLFMNMIQSENEPYIINKITSLVISAINNYIPQSNYIPKKNVFKMLSEKCFKKDIIQTVLYKNMVNYILDLINPKNKDMMNYFFEICLGVQLEETSIFNDDHTHDEKKKYHCLANLDINTKKRLVSTIFQSNFPSIYQKNFVKDSILSIQEVSKVDEEIFQTCQIEANEKEVKQSLWNLFVYRDLIHTDQEVFAYMRGFKEINRYCTNLSIEDNKYFLTKRFFKDIVYVLKYYPDYYALQFYKYLSPRFLPDEKVLKKLVKLREYFQDSDDPAHQQLRVLVAQDIIEMQKKLLIMKFYSTLTLTNFMDSPLRHFR